MAPGVFSWCRFLGDKMKNKAEKKHTAGGYFSERDIKWDKLDNTANLFPVIAGEDMTNVYRISVTLKEEINPQKLKEALDIILPKFGGFNVRLRQGVFWYYFEENGKRAPKARKMIIPAVSSFRIKTVAICSGLLIMITASISRYSMC